MIVCASCSKENEDFFLFCISCGGSLESVETDVFEPIPDIEDDDNTGFNLGIQTQETQPESSPEHIADAIAETSEEDVEDIGLITFADFEAAEPALTIPVSRPNNKSLTKTVVTDIVFDEPVVNKPPEQAPFDSAKDDIGSAASREDDIALPFLTPLEIGLVKTESTPNEEIVDVAIEEALTPPDATQEVEHIHEPPAVAPVLNMGADTEADIPAVAMEEPAPNTPRAQDLPIIMPVDWTATTSQVNEIPPQTEPTLRRAIDQPIDEPEPQPIDKPEPKAKEPTPKPKTRKRKRQAQSKKKGHICGQIIRVHQDGYDADRFDLFSDTTWLGSSRGDINFGHDECIAKKHAVLFYEQDILKVRSLDKTNGVFIRLASNNPVRLQSGDQFRIGQELLQFEARADMSKHETISPDGTQSLGSPISSASWGLLYQRITQDESGNVFVLDRDDISLGRDEGEITFPDDGTVSGTHARLNHTNGTVTIEDLGSSNGTYIRLHGTTTLSDGDFILIGEQVLRIAL